MMNSELLNGQELISNHLNAVKDLPSKGLKEYCPSNSWHEKTLLKKQLEEKYNFINTERIEKSNALSKAEWMPHLRKARVLKKAGKSWETLGHHQDNEDWLLPEEALFLVENCELELELEDVCMSIEDCYMILLDEDSCSFDQYRVYSYLCRAGLRVVIHSPSVKGHHEQVQPDSIIESPKKSPVDMSLSNASTEVDVTIIDDDICIINKNVGKNDCKIKNNLKTGCITTEVIEIDDDEEEKPHLINITVTKELVDIDDDSDDSDIVCISSPSYIPDQETRAWYLPTHKCLQRKMDQLIDLSEETDTVDNKELIRRRFDLIRVTRADIMSSFASAKTGVTYIQSPDKRLVPNNVSPKYFEYKANLNIRRDIEGHRHYYDTTEEPLLSAAPIPSLLENVNNIPALNNTHYGVTNTPLFRKAEEMQVMAMGMMQTAASLITALNTQNPNELWNYSNIIEQGQPSFRRPIMPVRTRFGNHPRPYYRFPQRRNYRYPRRRHYTSYNRGHHWGPRKQNFNNGFSNNELSTQNLEENDVIVLGSSDESEVDGDDKHNIFKCSNGKRQMQVPLKAYKKPKLERDTSVNLGEVLLISDDSDDVVHTQIKQETEIVPPSHVVKDEHTIIKDEAIIIKHMDPILNVKAAIQIDLIGQPKNTIDKSFGVKSEKRSIDEEEGRLVNVEIPNIECAKIQCQATPIKSQTPKTDLNDINTVNIRTCHSVTTSDEKNDMKSTEGEVPVDDTDKVCFEPEVEAGCSRSNTFLNDEEPHQGNMDVDDHRKEITSWEEYKNLTTDLRSCNSYGSVLKALQIFQPIEPTSIRKKYKANYDVYLPTANFKKSLKVPPSYRVIITKSTDELPTSIDLQCLKIEYQDGIPFLFTIVFDETLAFYMFDTVCLNTLNE